MINIFKRLKMAIIIGVCAVIIANVAFDGKPLTESWFITGESLFATVCDDDGITIIKDESEDIEFRCGIFDMICSWFD